MLISVAGWLVCFAIGVALQRRRRDPHRVSHTIFMVALWVLSPLVVIYADTTVLIHPELVAAFACVIAVVASSANTASWLSPPPASRCGSRLR